MSNFCKFKGDVEKAAFCLISLSFSLDHPEQGQTIGSELAKLDLSNTLRNLKEEIDIIQSKYGHLPITRVPRIDKKISSH